MAVGAFVLGVAAFGLFGSHGGDHGAAAGAARYTVYNDSLSSGWVDWSWDSTTNYGATAFVYSGTKSIAWTATAAYGGLYMHTNTPINSAPYTSLTFALRAT